MVGHIIRHSLESKAVYGAEKHAPPELQETVSKLPTEVWHTVSTGFPYYGVAPVLIYLGLALVVVGVVFYNLVAKGRGSHAGREEVRRAYRRKLAQEMAHQDAEKIKAGAKPRRWWMQW